MIDQEPVQGEQPNGETDKISFLVPRLLVVDALVQTLKEYYPNFDISEKDDDVALFSMKGTAEEREHFVEDIGFLATELKSIKPYNGR